ncbi:factor of DNA methylation 4-like [Gastrolobium bilobum]|uniref:factor of DNA methylation 4-like n=1 Tax=Gastrolobium bilobum TaxID=150636 RepID=UPI002AB28106|nr:factor of DNA methylation 4-like [Gastrolobium bilobum]
MAHISHADEALIIGVNRKATGMSHQSERIRESDFKYYERRYYDDLKNGCFTIKISNSTYRCPFCLDRQDYSSSELLKHASRFAKGSHSREIEDRAKHFALQLYIERYVGESGTKLREEFTLKGFRPLRVHPLWNHNGHSGFAIVDFSTEWDGFTNAINFERSFEAEHCGKKDYYSLKCRGDRLYEWLARDDDYHMNSIIGVHLRKKGDLKTVSEKQADDKRKTSQLVSSLANTLKMKNKELEWVRSKYDEIDLSLNKVIEQKEEMIKSFNNEIQKMQQSDRDHLEKILMDHEKARLRLEAQKKELLNREKDLQRRQERNENERERRYI